MDPKLQVDRLHVSAPQGNQTGRLGCNIAPGLAVFAKSVFRAIDGSTGKRLTQRVART